MWKNGKFSLAAAFLGTVHLLALLAGWVAPYDYATQNRSLPLAPPTRLHFFDSEGKFHFRPFVYPWVPNTARLGGYEEDRARPLPVRFFVPGEEGTILGVVPVRLRLFGVDAPGQIFLLGTDDLGRDQFSRMIYGGQISLLAGLLAASLSLGAGLILGMLAGYHGRWADELLMRVAEVFLSLPWIYLLFAVRAFLPLHIPPSQAFLLVVAVTGLIGWARPARLIRGMVLSARERNYVLAARGFGASGFYILRRHILPHTLGITFTQAALLIPQCILAEVTLSFLGLGIGEPMPSWGNMLASLQHYNVLVAGWWNFLPGLILIPIFLSYQLVADGLQKRLEFTPL